jgi:chromosome segregation ATPase
VTTFRNPHERIEELMQRVGQLESELAEVRRRADVRTDALVEAEARIAQLEAALREIADFSEQFIGDDEDGDERMYKVNQIAREIVQEAALQIEQSGKRMTELQ